MITNLTPELRLITNCIQRALGQPATAPDDGAIDWETFTAEVARQGLAPLVDIGLASMPVSVPDEIRAQLKAGHAVATLRSKALLPPSLRLTLTTLESASVQAVVLKGAALAFHAYPKPSLRTLIDIDLLVASDQLRRSVESLFASGFVPIDVAVPDGHQHLQPYRTPNGHFVVELHDRLLSDGSPYTIETPGLLARSRVRELVGMRANVLAPADALLHVCVHMAYGHRYQWFPLRSLVDILVLTLSEPELDWDLLVATVLGGRASGAVYWPLRLSRDWLAAPIPEEVLVHLAPPRVLRRLVEPIIESPYVLDGRAPPDWGTFVLHDTIRELSLYAGCSRVTQVSAILRSLFPPPDRLGHLPEELTRSRLRYGAYLGRPRRLVRGAMALAHLLTQGGNREMIAEVPASTVTGTVKGEPAAYQPVTLSVVIPAFNEEDGIAAIIERIEAVRTPLASAGVDGLEIIVVDDGSQDRTADIAASHATVRLIQHSTNQGYGAAIKTGFNAASGQLLAFTDADGTYPPERFPELCRVALQQDADVVVGSRRSGEHSEMPRVRRVGNFIWSNLVSVIGNHRVADPASGMRVLRASALHQLYPLPDGLNFTPVMSTRCVHENLKVVEVAIPYTERVGRSKLSVVRDGTRFLKTILWTSLEYNPVRVLGLVGVTALGLAGAIAFGIVWLRLQGVTQLGQWGAFSVFSVLVLAVTGMSIFSLGATFNYLVSLFRREPVRQGLFGRPLLKTPVDRHFGWLGLLASSAGVGLALASLALSLWGEWDIARLWLWLLASAMLVLVGLQLVVSWIVMRVLDTLSTRELRIEQEMHSIAAHAIAPSVLGASGAD